MLNFLKSKATRNTLPEKVLDLIAGLALGIIFLLGIAHQFLYRTPDYPSLARPQAVSAAINVEEGSVPEDLNRVLPKTR